MKRILTVFVLAIAMTTYASGECGEADKKALEAFDRAWSEAGLKGDRAALMNIYANDYQGLPGMLNKTVSIENTMRTFEANKTNPNAANVVTDHYIITCTPVTATVTHRNTITTRNGAGKEETSYSRSVHFLEKRAGKWQVVSNAGNALDDSAMLTYMELDWGNAIKNRDAAWMEKNYAADFSEVSFMTGELMNKKQAIDGFKNDKMVTDSFETSDLNIRVDGNTAVATGVVRIKGKDEKGRPVDMRLRYTDTFIRRDGRWQAWATQAMVLPK